MLDLNINGHTKKFLTGKFEEWYASEITKQLDGGSNIYDVNVPLKLSAIKAIHTKWLIGLYDYFRNNRDMIVKSFEMAGLKEALEINLPPENPFKYML